MLNVCLYAKGAAVSQDNMGREVDAYLRRKYENSIRDIEIVHKEDLALVSVHIQQLNSKMALPEQIVKPTDKNSKRCTEIWNSEQQHHVFIVSDQGSQGSLPQIRQNG